MNKNVYISRVDITSYTAWSNRLFCGVNSKYRGLIYLVAIRNHLYLSAIIRITVPMVHLHALSPLFCQGASTPKFSTYLVFSPTYPLGNLVRFSIISFSHLSRFG